MHDIVMNPFVHWTIHLAASFMFAALTVAVAWWLASPRGKDESTR